MKQFLTKNTSKWHFNAKNGHFGTKSKYLKKSKLKSKLNFEVVHMIWHVGHSLTTLLKLHGKTNFGLKFEMMF